MGKGYVKLHLGVLKVSRHSFPVTPVDSCKGYAYGARYGPAPVEEPR
jgi:hypothetical protein